MKDLEEFNRNIIRKVEIGAIDLDDDGEPDLLSVAFCCGDETESVNSAATDCNYSCEKYFKKNQWSLEIS